jgi:hypothetical protein
LLLLRLGVYDSRYRDKVVGVFVRFSLSASADPKLPVGDLGWYAYGHFHCFRCFVAL